MRTKEQIEAGESMQVAIQKVLDAYTEPDLARSYASDNFIVAVAVDVLEEIPEGEDRPAPVRVFCGKDGLERWKVAGLRDEIDYVTERAYSD